MDTNKCHSWPNCLLPAASLTLFVRGVPVWTSRSDINERQCRQQVSCHLCARLLLIITDKSWFALKSNVSKSGTFVGFCFALVYLLDKTSFWEG